MTKEETRLLVVSVIEYFLKGPVRLISQYAVWQTFLVCSVLDCCQWRRLDYEQDQQREHKPDQFVKMQEDYNRLKDLRRGFCLDFLELKPTE